MQYDDNIPSICSQISVHGDVILMYNPPLLRKMYVCSCKL